MPPPTLMVLKNKSTPIQVRKLLAGTSLDPTQDGSNITADTTAEAITTSENPNNPLIEAFGKRFLWHRSFILERDIGGDGAWGISLNLNLLGITVRSGKFHSGLHVLHPNGVETLAGLFVRSEIATEVYSITTTDGINWTTTLITTLGPSWGNFGRSVVFESSIYWLAFNSSTNTVMIARDVAIGATTTWITTDFFSNWVATSGQTSDFAIHKDKLFLAASRTNQLSFEPVLFRLDGSTWVNIGDLDAGATNGGGVEDRGLIISDGADLIFFYNDNLPTCIRIQNPLTASITTVDITATVLSGVGGGTLGQWQKYRDVTTPGSAVWYLWYNQGGQNVGSYDCYQYNGIAAALTLVGSGIAAADFTLPNVDVGGNDRIPAKTEGRPQFDGAASEVTGGGRKRFFRVYGVGSDLTLSQYHNVDSEAPETLSSLAASSIVIEDATDATGLVGNLGEVAIEALTPTTGDSYVVSDIDGDGSLTPGAVAISEGDIVTFGGTNWTVQVSGNLPLFTDLEAYYKMEGTGSRVDSSGNGLTLTETGTVATGTGIFGNGADFPGTANNFLSRGEDPALDIGLILAPFAVQAWVDPDTLSETVQIVGKTNAFDGWALRILSTGVVEWRQSASTIVSSAAGAITVAAGLQHILVTSDSITTRLYVDGVEVDSATSVAMLDSNTGLFVGSTATTERFDGIIDEVAIWSRHVTTAEVAALFNSGSGKQLEHHGFPTLGTHATLNSSTALIAPFTDTVDDGKTASFAGTSLDGIALTAPSNTTSQITVTPDNGATQYSYNHAASTDSLSTGDKHTVMLDIV